MRLAQPTFALLALALLPVPSAAAAAAPPHAAFSDPAAEKIGDLVKALRSDDISDQISAAQTIGDMGKKGADAVPALIESLGSEQSLLVDACVEALVAIGSKARDPLVEALNEGKVGKVEVPRGPIARALLQMGKRARNEIDDYLEKSEPGPEQFALFEDFGEEGASFLIRATEDPANRVEVLRSLRRLASRDTRKAETIEDAIDDVEDAALKTALTLAWTQSPSKSEVAVLEAWLSDGVPELAETALWCAGLLGSDAQGLASGVRKYFSASDPLLRETALWAIASLPTSGPGLPSPRIPASFPGGAAGAAGAVAAATGGDVFLLWRDFAKPLGYRGRISKKARGYWALAPTWTNQVDAVPPAPDRSKFKPELLAAEADLISLLGSDDASVRDLASTALSALGCKDESARDLWVSWLTHDDPMMRRAGLVGLRPFGREVIEHQEAILPLLKHPDTQIAAAQILTEIATPNGWKAVAEHAATIEGKTPLPILLAMSRYDSTALRPFLPKMTEQYHRGGYIMAALLLRFGSEAVPVFEFELAANLADRRMVAAESLGHLGEVARPALPALKKVTERHGIAQKLLKDAIKRIE